MSTAADNILDGAMAAAEDGQPTDDRIILSIDEPSRTIRYDGNLILGVQGDRFAERIYFRCPQYVYKDTNEAIDLSLDTTKIKVNYKNAYTEPYIEECAKHGLENGEYTFSWFISDWATVKNGTVTFNICVIDESETLKDKDGNVIVQEWHTTTFNGTILPAIDVSDVTPEVYTSDTKTSKAIVDEIKVLESKVDSYETKVADDVSDAMATYSNATTTDLYNKFETYKAEANDYIDGELDTHVDEIKSELKAWDESYVINILEEPGPDNSYNYNTTFDFGTFDSTCIEKYVCVVDRLDSRIDTDVVLPITEFAVNSPITTIVFSNGEVSLEVQYNSETGSLSISEISTISPIAEEIYQTTAVSSEDYNSDYPLLCSSDDSPMADDDTIAMGTLRAQNVTVNPKKGSISADMFVEGGVTLENKYASKTPKEILISLYFLNSGDADESTLCNYRRYSFGCSDDIANGLPKTKYIRFGSGAVQYILPVNICSTNNGSYIVYLLNANYKKVNGSFNPSGSFSVQISYSTAISADAPTFTLYDSITPSTVLPTSDSLVLVLEE